MQFADHLKDLNCSQEQQLLSLQQRLEEAREDCRRERELRQAEQEVSGQLRQELRQKEDLCGSVQL